MSTRVPLSSGGWTFRDAGWRTATLVVEVDPERILARLGAKAAKSKGRKAQCLGGAIVVRMIAHKDTPPDPTS